MLTVFGIVRDEEECIGRMIRSVEGFADSVFLVDTGSQDDTIDVARNLGATVVTREWVNFGTNLTEALALASFGSDWCLRMDADMTVDYLHEDFYEWVHNDATAQAYNVVLMEPGLSWRLPLLTSAECEWEYVGPTHEYLDQTGRSVADVAGLVIRHHADGSNRADKFIRDIELLAEGVMRGDPRATFYSADAYRCLGQFEHAHHLFTKRANMRGTWEEERWYAQYRAADCLLQFRPEEGVHDLVVAWQARPSRSEPLMRIREFCDQNRIQVQSTDRLFVEPGAYV